MYTKEDSTSPTVKIKSVIITAVIDTKENRYIAIADIPQAFLKAMLPDDTYMKWKNVCVLLHDGCQLGVKSFGSENIVVIAGV